LGNANGFDQPLTWLAANDSNKGYLAMGGDFNGDLMSDNYNSLLTTIIIPY